MSLKQRSSNTYKLYLINFFVLGHFTVSLMKQHFVLFWQCVFGPKLYQTYPTLHQSLSPHDHQANHLYTKNTTEALSDNVFLFLKIAIGVLRDIWPLCLFYFHRQKSSIYESGVSCSAVMISIAIIYIYFMLLRGISRFINPSYRVFINEYVQVKTNPTKEIRQKLLSQFDFSLSHWKPDYTTNSSIVRQLPVISITDDSLIEQTESTLIERLFHYPSLFLGYMCVNLFGRRLMFPGSLEIFRHMRSRDLMNGRRTFIVSYRAKRSILRTADGNRIDTIFVDRRASDNGQILVITCEGNAGFYEVGSMITPMRAGYSVFGWNRPGFGESSGSPGALSEINSIDTVMRYAIDELHFPVNKIIIFAWSIGGYAACWAAVHYQDIHGLVLDAIFDDILPLAQRQMPSFTSKFVQKTVRHYLDLNNIRLLKLYNGPFYLIRRTQDEIMNGITSQPKTNRANEILFYILPYRYPFIYNSDEILTLLKQYICSDSSQKNVLYDIYGSDNLQIQTDQYRLANPIASYPCEFGKHLADHERKCFAVYLVDEYLIDFDSKHCTSLPQRYFSKPYRCV